MTEEELRRRSPLLRGLAETRLVRVEDGPGAGGRLLQVRTPSALALDVALDRGGDVLRLAWRGVELGWHSAAGAPAPWPPLEDDRGLGFLRGFDGFLVTCGLDHHGVPAQSDAAAFRYPSRERCVHPLHGRIMAARAELLRREVDWEAGRVEIRTVARQASVFGEVLELDRRLSVALHEPRLAIDDVVTNRGFRPTRHGLLYHVNLGHPLLGEGSRLVGEGWALRDRLDGGAAPEDDHVEVVEVGPSPPMGIGLENPAMGVRLTLRYGAEALPVTALWRAFQSGVFALGLEPQTDLAADPPLRSGEARRYALEVELADA
jgi:hypothetical protein